MASIQRHRSAWRCKWYDETGQQRYKSFPTRPEAEAFKDRVEATVVLKGSAPAVLDGAVTLAQWWDRWEPAQDWRTSSRNSAGTHWRRWIKPTFGSMPVAAISTIDVRHWHRVLEEKGLSPAYRNQINTTLVAVLKGAVVDEVITRNPASSLRTMSRQPREESVALDPSTTAAVLAAIEATTPALTPLAECITVTGLRRAEAVGLTWDRVDLDAKTILIDRQLDFHSSTPKHPTWGPVKNSRRVPSRTVILTDTAAAQLRAHRRHQEVPSIHGLVFTQPDGGAWRSWQLSAAWQKAVTHLKTNGLVLPAGARGWHVLRHGVASRLAAAGVPDAEAAAMMGQSVAEFHRTYVHVVDRDAAHDRLRSALG